MQTCYWRVVLLGLVGLVVLLFRSLCISAAVQSTRTTALRAQMAQAQEKIEAAAKKAGNEKPNSTYYLIYYVSYLH